MTDSDPRTTLAALADARGDSLAKLSVMLERNAAYLQQYVRRGTPRVLAERDRRFLADYFGVAQTRLGGPVDDAPMHVPRLDVAASAGPGSLVDADVMLGTETLDPALVRRLRLRDGAASVIRVRGDSMAPGLVDGDHIVVDTHDRRPGSHGGIYVIRIDEAVMVKRVARSGGVLSVTSDNPDAAPVPDGARDVIGRVVWQMRVPR